MNIKIDQSTYSGPPMGDATDMAPLSETRGKNKSGEAPPPDPALPELTLPPLTLPPGVTPPDLNLPGFLTPPVGRSEKTGSVGGTEKYDFTNAKDNLKADIENIMLLLMKTIQEMKRSAREDRVASLSMEANAMSAAADEIRASAADKLVGAAVSGALTIASGAASLTTASVNLKTLSGNAKKPDVELPDIAKGTTKDAAGISGKTPDQNLSDQIQTINALGQGAGQTLSGTGSIVAGAMEASAAGHEADKADKDRDAKLAETAFTQADERVKQMAENFRDVLEKLAAILQSDTQTNQNIASKMA